MLDNKKFVAGYVPWEVGLDPANHSKGGVNSRQDEGQHKGQDKEPAHGGGRVHAILHLVLQQHTHTHTYTCTCSYTMHQFSHTKIYNYVHVQKHRFFLCSYIDFATIFSLYAQVHVHVLLRS